MKEQYLKILDIGHSGNSPDDAMTTLETFVSQCAYENKVRAIKVITGHGSGALRKILRQWCDEQEGRFKGVIYGEDYDMFNKTAVNMRSECNQPIDNDFGNNQQLHIYGFGKRW